LQHEMPNDVAHGSKADLPNLQSDVRFSPKSRHRLASVHVSAGSAIDSAIVVIGLWFGATTQSAQTPQNRKPAEKNPWMKELENASD
jgi:hypothetical protein